MSFPQRSDLLYKRYSSLNAYYNAELRSRFASYGMGPSALSQEDSLSYVFAQVDDMLNQAVGYDYYAWRFCRPDGTVFHTRADFLAYAGAAGFLPEPYGVSPRIGFALGAMKCLYALRYHHYAQQIRTVAYKIHIWRNGLHSESIGYANMEKFESKGTALSFYSELYLPMFMYEKGADTAVLSSPSTATKYVPTNLPHDGILHIDTPLDPSDPDESYFISLGFTHRSIRFSYSDPVQEPTTGGTYCSIPFASPVTIDMKHAIEVNGGTVPETYDP